MSGNQLFCLILSLNWLQHNKNLNEKLCSLWRWDIFTSHIRFPVWWRQILFVKLRNNKIELYLSSQLLNIVLLIIIFDALAYQSVVLSSLLSPESNFWNNNKRRECLARAAAWIFQVMDELSSVWQDPLYKLWTRALWETSIVVNI